uniref:CCHC-type domain-containing protein n=1 Tax=Strigamia maritima TaxID=126957 RepID=T1IZA0_STRMM
MGHTATKCAKSKCYNCNGIGHISFHCKEPKRARRGKPQNVKRVVAMVPKFSSKMVVAGENFVAGIDTQSDLCLVGKTFANGAGIDEPKFAYKIWGFNYGVNQEEQTYFGRTRYEVQVDGLKIDQVPFHVVNDEVMVTDVWMGQPLLERENVSMKVDGGKISFHESVKIGENLQSIEPRKLVADEKTVLEAHSINFIQMKVEKFDTGIVYLQQELSQIDGLKVMEGITSVENGCIRVPVVNQEAAAVQIKKGRKIGRIEVFDVPSLQCSEVRKITTEGRSEILLKDISVGEGVASENARKLVELINEFQDCFATNLLEVGKFENLKMEIELASLKIINLRRYPYSAAQQKEIDTMMDIRHNDDIWMIC